MLWLGGLLAAALFAGDAGPWTPVATDALPDGQEPAHLSSGGVWHFPADALPITAALPDKDPLRWCAFGDPLTFDYSGLKSAARYRVTLTFVTDGDRTESLVAGGSTLAAAIVLKVGPPLTQTFDLPPASYADGKLHLEVRKLAGPNAVASKVVIESTDATPLAVPPPPAPIEPPRLSPPPADVAGVKKTRVELNGTWRFHPAPTAGFERLEAATGEGWSDIAVPGEWVMQGFTVKPGVAAAYRRTFTVPAEWAGQRIKLRADAVYSEATVFVNGVRVGHHLGGFTPFEIDITQQVKPGAENVLAMSVLSDSVADKLASGSQYAMHPLGGIPRKIYLMAVPPLNVAAIDWTTTFDADFKNAKLAVRLDAANDGAADLPAATARLSLAAPDGQSAGPPVSIDLGAMKAGQSAHAEVTLPVAAAQTWDPEHPRLYRLRCQLSSGETTEQRAGLRQIEVRGNQVFVNGRPIKLRGACHHEVHPLYGRAVPPEQERRDVELFIEGNCNFLRTSHYPDSEEFLDACDELGMFVGSEAPMCWSPGAGHRELLVGQTLEMVRFNRRHPCIIYWSLGNESQWGADFAASAAAVKAFDPSVPRIFSDGGGYNAPVELISRHYPGLGGPAAVANGAKPTIFDEYIHLNCYNRHELETDPGLRDIWGRGFEVMYDKMRASQGCLGGSIWAAIDDTFFPPPDRLVGYGAWGPLDGWRRPKPEYWHMKKVYSPLRISMATIAPPKRGEALALPVENRFEFSDLSEVRFTWRCGQGRGEARAAAAPGTTGTLDLKLSGQPVPGEDLDLSAQSPRGFVLDRWRWTFAKPGTPPDGLGLATLDPPTLERGADVLTVRSGKATFTVDAHTGQFGAPLLGGPHLALIALDGRGDSQMNGKDGNLAPNTATCTEWKAASVTAEAHRDSVTITVRGAYREASGGYTLTFGRGAELTVAYDFTVTQAVDPRQIGLVFDVPRAWDALMWERNAQWSGYPDDHIGRPHGLAMAFYPDGAKVGQAGPRTAPTWPWSHDANDLGSNDFRATRFNVSLAMLLGPSHGGMAEGLGMQCADAHQHVRCWVDGDRIRMLVADYANEGAAPFFNEHTIPHRKLATGDHVTGTVTLMRVLDLAF